MVGPFCIAVLAANVLEVLPVDRVILVWQHSVEATRWEEEYLATKDGLQLVSARIEAPGAGMEPPAGAIREEGVWRYRPELPLLEHVELANSTFAAGYSLCSGSTCRPLASIVPLGTQAALASSRCSRLPSPISHPG